MTTAEPKTHVPGRDPLPPEELAAIRDAVALSPDSPAALLLGELDRYTGLYAKAVRINDALIGEVAKAFNIVFHPIFDALCATCHRELENLPEGCPEHSLIAAARTLVAEHQELTQGQRSDAGRLARVLDKGTARLTSALSPEEFPGPVKAPDPGTSR